MYLGVRKVVKCLLIGGIGILEIVLHKETVAKGAPYVAVLALKAEHTLKIVDSLGGDQYKLTCVVIRLAIE
jgi:hypothetical protein